MKKMIFLFCVSVLAIALVIPGYAADDMAKKLNDVLSKGPSEGFWQIAPDDVLTMINAKKTDFVIVDVRPNPAEYKETGHIPGAIQITVQDIFKPENLNKLPKDKKLIVVCVTGQTQNLPIVGLRALGYNAYTMKFGMAAWQKGYRGAQLMQEAIKGADAKNFPLVK